MATLRHIRPDDDPAMARIIREVMTEHGAVGPGYSINDPEVDAMCEWYAAPGAAFYVVEDDGEVIGGAGFARLAGGPEDVCELRKMYLLPAGRGRGFGRQLLERILEDAKADGYRQCYLETLTSMHRARELYTSFGFQPLDAPMGATGHFTCDAWLAKEL